MPRQGKDEYIVKRVIAFAGERVTVKNGTVMFTIQRTPTDLTLTPQSIKMSLDSLLLEMSIRPYQKAQYSLWAITVKEAILATLETAWGQSPFMTSLGQLAYE